jgi:Tfp pilus assembly protein PilF
LTGWVKKTLFAELQNLAWVEFHRGNFDVAEHCFAESEKLESANDPYNLSMTSPSQAFIAYGRGDKNRAQTLLQRVQSILKEAEVDLGPDDLFEFNRLSGRLEENVSG